MRALWRVSLQQVKFEAGGMLNSWAPAMPPAMDCIAAPAAVRNAACPRPRAPFGGDACHRPRRPGPPVLIDSIGATFAHGPDTLAAGSRRAPSSQQENTGRRMTTARSHWNQFSQTKDVE